jgi:hypothetical protein
MKALTVIVLLFAATVRAGAEQWVHASVYFRGWYTERAVAVTPQGLRDEARQGYSRVAHISSPSELSRLLSALDLPRLHPMRGDPGTDTYLVIDLFDSARTRTTYRSNRFYLLSADCTRGRKVDERFRKFFEKFTPRPNQAMQRTASKPAIDLLRVCHPRVGSVACCSGLAVADLVSR